MDSVLPVQKGSAQYHSGAGKGNGQKSELGDQYNRQTVCIPLPE